MNKVNIMENIASVKESIWHQFGASLDMLENAIRMCPDEHWDTQVKFWYSAYHCIFWTDYYLSVEPAKFGPPAPFTFSEFDSEGKMPERTYSKAEVLGYLAFCRHKANKLISGLTLDLLNSRWIDDHKDFSLLEMLLYNLRHIQHHTAQLNLVLRQTINNAPKWVRQAEKVREEV